MADFFARFDENYRQIGSHVNDKRCCCRAFRYGPLLMHRNYTHIGKTILETGLWEKDKVNFPSSLVTQLCAIL